MERRTLWVFVLAFGFLCLAGGGVPAVELVGWGYALENGDVNGDQDRDVSDGVYLLSFLFLGGPGPVPLATFSGVEPAVANGDSNGDGTVDLSDSVRLLSWLYTGGPEPVSAGGEGAGAGTQGNPRVIPLNARAFGKSYSQLAADFWKWGVSMPVSANPLFDTADPSAGQSGKVWFLGGTFTVIEIEPGVIRGEVTRECTIPAGKAIFFPLVNSECSTAEGNGTTEAELRECANFFGGFATNLSCEIDGRALKNLENYRVDSPLYTMGPLPDDNLFQAFGLDVPEGSTTQSVADGYHILLPPFSAGYHTIDWYAESDYTSIGGPLFIQDITYHIEVMR